MKIKESILLLIQGFSVLAFYIVKWHTSVRASICQARIGCLFTDKLALRWYCKLRTCTVHVQVSGTDDFWYWS